jgi:hypothetical protein
LDHGAAVRAGLFVLALEWGGRPLPLCSLGACLRAEPSTTR